MTAFGVLIVGGGHAGAHAAIALRQKGFLGTIAIVGEEPDLPYERPPLSKDYLAGAKSFDRILLRSASFWVERDITMLLGRRVVDVRPEERAVLLADGQIIGYGRLIWAAGGPARQLACQGHDLRGVHTLRTRADVDKLSAELEVARHVVIVGAGYVGLETAAALRMRGLAVTVIEAQSRVLQRVTGVAIAPSEAAADSSR